MWKVLIAGFLVVHGLIHTSFLTGQPPGEPGGPRWPFHLDRSQALSGAGLGPSAVKAIGTVLVVLVVAGFALAGLGLLLDQEWWRPLAVAAAAVSFLQIGLFFDWMLSLGLVIDLGIGTALLATGWTGVDLVGA